MLQIKIFPFNHYGVNTLVLWDETKQCVLIDVACTPEEEPELKNFIAKNDLTPVHILLTHAHVDHLVGLYFAVQTYKLPVSTHKGSKAFMDIAHDYGQFLGFNVPDLKDVPCVFMEDGDVISFGNNTLKVLYCPGHAPDSLCYVSDEAQVVVTGDVLFNQSIGRTDLTGGDFDQLMHSIKTRLMTLDGTYRVIPGHGPDTSIMEEKLHNPFLESL